MSYILNGLRPLVFYANPRTGSTAIANALLEMGAQVDGGHHAHPIHIPLGAIVMQTVRSHFEVLNSLWFKGRPGSDFPDFIQRACGGGYQYAKIPMYNNEGVTHTLRYEHLEKDFRWACAQAGFRDPPLLEWVNSRTQGNLFTPALEDKVRDTWGEEMEYYGL